MFLFPNILIAIAALCARLVSVRNELPRSEKMTNYTKQPDHRPWARDLDSGDILTYSQAMAVNPTRLDDFGLELVCRSAKEWPRNPSIFHPKPDATYRVIARA